MKWLKLVWIHIGICTTVSAQNFQEWVNQNVTQQKYLIEQIAHLKLYLELAEKGYEVAREGLTLISSIKRGEFRLHRNRFDSLLVVGQAVIDYGRRDETINMLLEARLAARLSLQELGSKQQFSVAELKQIKDIYDKALKDCTGVYFAMSNITQNEVVAMTDDERIKRLDVLYQLMLERYRFFMELTARFRSLADQKQRETLNIQISRELSGIK